MRVWDGLKWFVGSINASSGEKTFSYLPIVGGEDQGGIITRADGGGEELFFVSQPDSGPLQHNRQKNIISIWTQDSHWTHRLEEVLDVLHYDHILGTSSTQIKDNIPSHLGVIWTCQVRNSCSVRTDSGDYVFWFFFLHCLFPHFSQRCSRLSAT